MAFTLTLLGTDTQFSPGPVDNAYDRAETLSYISSLINKDSTLPTDDVTRFRSHDVTVIDGPTTLGPEIGDRIARGVAAVLEAVSRGETEISVIAHSRGAVEAILVAHELERIQNLIKEKGLDSFSPEILNSVCKYTKTAMTEPHKNTFEGLNWGEIGKHIGSVKLSMLNIDPVPGGNYVGITHISSLAWRDPRFYEVPKIVKEYEQYVYENERSRCFKPIVPKCVSSETKFKLQSLPGHHGTGSGNLLDQQRGVNPSPKSTVHVQELVVVRIIDFLTRNGVNITPRAPDSDPFAHLIAELFIKDSKLSRETRFRNLYFSLYNHIIENRDAYLHYNNTSYAVLGQEQAIARKIWRIINQRIVHYQAHNDTFLETIIPPVLGGHFLNYEHARMQLNDELGIGDDVQLSETINTAVTRLVTICQHTKKLKDLKKAEGPQDLTASLVGDHFAHTLESKESFDLLLDGIGTLIEETRQSYLQNKLTDSSERGTVYDAVHRTFTEFARLVQEEPTNELSQTIFAKLKADLELTLNMKRNVLKEQYQDLANKLKEKSFLNELEDKIQSIVDHLEEKKTLDNSSETVLLEELKGFIVKSKQLQAGNPLSYQVKQFLDSELKALREIEISGELAIQSREGACLVIDEAIDENLTYLLPHIIQEVVSSSNALEQFKKALPDFKALDSSLNYEQWESELEEYRARVIYLAAQYIHGHNIPLVNVQIIFGEENQDLYKQIAGLAIGMGVVNPLSLTIEEKEHVIQELGVTNSEQAQQIRLLSTDRLEQAELIKSLTSGKDEQAKLIVLLTSEKKEQEQLVKSLTSTKEEQEQLIAKLSTAQQQLEEDNTELREKVALLNEQLEKLNERERKTATVDDDNEFNFQLIIKTKLTPLTKDYLIHLAKEVKKSVDPKVDISDFSNLVKNVKKIESWPKDESSQILKQKFDRVSELYDILEARDKPSVKLGQFYNKLNEADHVIQAHRDPAWKRYTMVALTILATVILPGLAILAYSAITGNKPKIWQSSGQTFFQKTKAVEENKQDAPEVRNSLPDAKS